MRLPGLDRTWLVLLSLASWVAPVHASAVPLVDGLMLETTGRGDLHLVRDGDVVQRIEPFWFAPGEDRGRAVRGDRVSSTDGGIRVRVLDREVDQRLRHWPYVHVEAIAFVDMQWVGPHPVVGRPGVRLPTEDGSWRRHEFTIRPHMAVGRAPRIEGEILVRPLTDDRGASRLVGVVRLDRVPIEHADGDTFVWESEHESWPLAIVAARSMSSLEHLAGQAYLTYDDAGRSRVPTWKVPPICGRCRNPGVDDLDLEFVLDADQLVVRARALGRDDLHPMAWDALSIEGQVLTDFHRSRRDGHELYVIGLDAPEALVLARAAARGVVDARLPMQAGNDVVLDDVAVTASPTLDTEVERRSPRALADELPTTLSTRLVNNWPNPFSESTVLEIQVPRTMGEAFDLEPEMQARIDTSMAPPFGSDPSVLVRVFNVSGKLVTVLEEGIRPTGRFTVQWDGTDGLGRPVAAGAYYINVQMGRDWAVTKRVVRLGN